jgi:hypothetical protein
MKRYCLLLIRPNEFRVTMLPPYVTLYYYDIYSVAEHFVIPVPISGTHVISVFLACSYRAIPVAIESD